MFTRLSFTHSPLISLTLAPTLLRFAENELGDEDKNGTMLPDTWLWNTRKKVVESACLFISVVFAFLLSFEDNELNTAAFWTNSLIIINSIFFLDFLLEFNTAVYDEHLNLITDRTVIAKRYLRSWASIDLLTCLPVMSFSSDKHSSEWVEKFR